MVNYATSVVEILIIDSKYMKYFMCISTHATWVIQGQNLQELMIKDICL